MGVKKFCSKYALLFAAQLLVFFSCNKSAENNMKEAGRDWPVYLGGNSSAQYTPLNQVNKHNVQQLKLAWEDHSGRDSSDNEKEGRS